MLPEIIHYVLSINTVLSKLIARVLTYRIASPPLEVYQLTVKSLYIYIATPDEPDHVTILILNLASIPSVSYSQSLPSHIALVH